MRGVYVIDVAVALLLLLAAAAPPMRAGVPVASPPPEVAPPAAAQAAPLPAPAPPPAAEPPPPLDARARQAAADVRFLAEAARWSAQGEARGHDAAALHVSSRMEAIGLAPAAGRGDWIQRVALRAWSPDVGSWSLSLQGHGRAATPALLPGEDFLALPDGDHSEVEVEAPVVFAGYGIAAPEFGYDDLRGVDLAGKIAVVLLGSPASDRANFFPPASRAGHADPAAKMRRLADRGAVGAILVWLPGAEGSPTWEEWFRRAHAGGLAWSGRAGAPAGMSRMAARAVLSPAGFQKFLAAAGVKGGLRAVQERAAANRLAAQEWPIRARLILRTDVREVESSSVVGLLPGSDAGRAREAVLVTAPLDAEGRDAAGVAVLLQVADRLVREGAPPRSVIFAALAGAPGERLGAEQLVRQLPPAVGAVVAQLGSDAALATRPFTRVEAAGAEAAGLRDAARVAAGRAGVELADPAGPGEEPLRRADGPVFGREGIPFTFLVPVAPEAGAAAAVWDAAALDRLARMEAELARELAQRAARP